MAKRVALAIGAVVLLACPDSWSSIRAPAARPRCAPGVVAWPDCTLWRRALPVRWLASDLAVEDVAFGIAVEGDDGGPRFSETQAVPYVHGQLYGWKLSLRTGRDRVRIREELTLPAVPASWGDAETSPLATISEDRRRVIVEEESTLDEMGRWWTIDHGDPRGLYKFRLYVEDVLVGEATFVVGHP